MANADLLEPVVAGVGLALSAGLTVPAISFVVREFRRARRRALLPLTVRTGLEDPLLAEHVLEDDFSPNDGEYLYQDKDGKATEESMDNFTDFYPRLVAFSSASAGLGFSVLATAIVACSDNNPSASTRGRALMVADIVAWAILCIQCAALPDKHRFRERYTMTLYALATSTVLLGSLLARYGVTLLHAMTGLGYTWPVWPFDSLTFLQILWLLEIVTAASAILAFASFQQRPDVFHKNRLVDQQHTASLLKRISFTWNKVVFSISKERQLNKADLPELDFTRRSKNISTDFLARECKGRLWWQLISAYSGRLGQQWALSFVISVLALFPQYVLYNFLEILDKPRGDNELPIDPALFAWVLCLCLSMLLQLWANSSMRWLTSSRLEQPVLSLLQGLVFQKAMRLKETASPPSKDADSNKRDSGEASKSNGSGTRQSIVNHMKLDTSRVVMFASWNYYFPQAIIKLALAGTFLVQLVGFKSLAAGLLSSLVVLPITRVLSKHYAKIQFGLMKYRDAKAHLLTEALQGMRQIKFSALEKHWEEKILASRAEELGQYWKVMCWAGFTSCVINLGPLLLSSVTLSVYAFTSRNGIKPSVIFASLGLFNELDEAIAYLPLLQVYMMESWTSCVRLEKFLAQPDREPIADPDDHISFKDATVAWPKFEEVEGEDTEPLEERSLLRELTLDFPNHELSLITGKTGSGKSLLLAAILGEATLISGKVYTPAPQELTEITETIPDEEWIVAGLTAFVPQTPWIETGTVKENIMFGLPFNSKRYSQVLAACALEKDIQLFADGDETEVGPKGVTLSGGQRWRVALARALYSRAEIMILDDVLSAVDAHVGNIILAKALTGELASGRTRILATHHADLCLPSASYLVKLDEGRLKSCESLNPTALGSSPASINPDDFSSQAGSSSMQTSTPDDQHSVVTTLEESDNEQHESQKPKPKKDAQEEGRERGNVKFKVYRDYLTAGKAVWLWVLAVLLIVAARFIAVGRTWSLKELAESDRGPYTASLANAGHAHNIHDYAYNQAYMQNSLMYTPVSQQGLFQKRSVTFWIGAYIVLELGAVIANVIRMLVFTAIGLRTARVLFQRMTHKILRAPVQWIDNTPSGRILNRFTADVWTLDRKTAMELGSTVSSVLSVLTIIAASLSVSKWVNVFGIVLFVFYVQIAQEYIATAREIKRLNSVVWSPIYDQFSSVLAGLSTIRGFGRAEFYKDRMYELIDTAAKTSWALSLCQRWMGVRMGLLGVLFVTIVAAAIVYSRVEAALAGFCLTFSLNYTSALRGLLESMSSIELSANATERVLEYCDLETDPEGGQDAPAAWPTQGRVEVDNLTVSYAADLPPVLKSLTFTVEGGERVGIVGRTGAGKSTLASVLFRLLEPVEGSVSIDNINIATLKLTQLRSRLAIIPQDPFLFSGTLRSNLDMEGEMDDYLLLGALQRVHLIRPDAASDPSRPSEYTTAASLSSAPAAAESASLDENTEAGPGASTPTNSNAFADLSMAISTGGANLSQGQRQLVCLARALLTRPKIVVLDEATSAVDRATDAAIQESLREEFVAAGCTVLVIAHRLSTVADFDKILVLKEGRVAQMGTPEELLRIGLDAAADGEQTDETAFWDLVRNSSEKDKLVEMIVGSSV